MPTVSIYIRKEDYAKWTALDKPGEFIHNALNGVGEQPKPVILPADGSIKYHKGKPIKTPTTTVSSPDYNKAIPVTPVIKTPKDAEKAVKIKGTWGTVCKIHGTPLDARGKCLQKGCKYA